MVCEKLRKERVIRPAVNVIERLVAKARSEAQERTFEILKPMLTDERTELLNHLLVTNDSAQDSLFSWLREESTTITATAILNVLKKIDVLRQWGVDQWDLSTLNNNRLTFLAQSARRYAAIALKRTVERRRYPLLIAFLHHALTLTIDEAIELFDRCLFETHSKADREREEYLLRVAESTSEKVKMLSEIGHIVLDVNITDHNLRSAIYASFPPERLRTEVEQCERLVRPESASYFNFLETRYSYLRQFVPAFLRTLSFQSNRSNDPLLRAIDILRTLNDEDRRNIPEGSPLEFISRLWLPHILNKNKQLDRHHYELSVLYELRNSLRSGNIWVEGSRRYANPSTYLIPPDRWPSLRREVCTQLNISEKGLDIVRKHETTMRDLLETGESMLASNESAVRVEKEKLVVSPLEAEDLPESVASLRDEISARLPRIDIADLLIEVDTSGSISLVISIKHTVVTTERGTSGNSSSPVFCRRAVTSGSAEWLRLPTWIMTPSTGITAGIFVTRPSVRR
jgi:hypothetical protein